MDPKAHSRPLSMPEITKRAETFDYNPLISIKYWLRTADALQKEASIYEREGNDQQAYLLLFRRAKLVLDCLSKHPERNRVEFRESLRAAEKQTEKTLGQLEVLKPKITARYERFAKQLRDQDVKRAALAKDRGENHLRSGSLSDNLPRTSAVDQHLGGFARPIAAAENGDLAVKLAHKELRRRRADRLGISEAEEQERRSGGVWMNWEQELAGKGGITNGAEASVIGSGDALSRDDLTRLHDQAVRTTAGRDGREPIRTHDGPSRKQPGQAGTHYNYPNVPKRASGEAWIPIPRLPSKYTLPPAQGILKLPRPRAENAFTKVLPSLPPKELLQNDNARQYRALIPPYESFAPTPPPKAPIEGTTPPSRSATATPASTDFNPAASLDPSTFTFKPSAYLENGTPLRTVFLPPTLRTAFLHIAAPNTARNLETCGILCGTLISNALFISRLVIPEQESTSDTCDTINEAALFEYCDNEDLMVLGWIHTHPTQTCFMSSRDLHTHCGYQVMMPESIAIVCAPSREPSWGIFRLTDPPGMQALLKCTQTGLFHPHGEGNIYTDALRPGHVFEATGMEFEVADLRPGHTIYKG